MPDALENGARRGRPGESQSISSEETVETSSNHPLPSDYLRLTARVVTGLDAQRHPLFEKASFESLLETLCERSMRLVCDRRTCDRLKAPFRQFIRNVIRYFHDRQALDDYTLTNIATALVCADCHGNEKTGTVDYSTLVRKLNPTDPSTDSYFIFGREGSINDPECPLRALENDSEQLNAFPLSQLHMFFAFYHARSVDISRGAPRVPVDDFLDLLPCEITADPDLEEAFLDICFSDGAWELYQRKFH